MTGRGWGETGAAVLAAALAAGDPARAEESCPAGGEAVRLAGVEARLELRLADGRLLRLAGLDPALSTPTAPDRDEEARAAFAALIPSQALAVRWLTTTPDRWGRLVATAFPAEGEGSQTQGGLAAKAVAAGLGRYLAEEVAHGCRATLVAAEDQARAQKLGLWADPYYAVLALDDRAGFAERAGTVVVVEGRLASVNPGPYRTTLAFADPSASHRGQTVSATIAPRAMKTFEAHGVHVSSLIGQTLRLRGLLDTRFGPQIELEGPDDLDVLAPVSAMPPTAAGFR